MLSIDSMRAPSAAVGRFYRAFYSWTIITNKSQPEARSRCLRTAFHTHSPLQLRIRRLAAGDRADSRSRHAGGHRGAGVGGGGGSDAEWKTAPVQSAVDKPFATLRPDEVVLRYRSEYGAMLECAVERRRLKTLQDRYGEKLEKLTATDGDGDKARRIRVEVQSLTARVPLTDETIVSVLLSGTFDQVDKVRRALKPSREANAAAGQQTQYVVLSPLVRPSHTMTPLFWLVREQSPGRLVVEISITERHFMKVVASRDLSSLGRRCGVSIAIGEPEQRPCHTSSSDMELARSLTITGSPTQALKAKNTIVAYTRADQESASADEGSRPSAVPATRTPPPRSRKNYVYGATFLLPVSRLTLPSYQDKLSAIGLAAGREDPNERILHVKGVSEAAIDAALPVIRKLVKSAAGGLLTPGVVVQEISRGHAGELSEEVSKLFAIQGPNAMDVRRMMMMTHRRRHDFRTMWRKAGLRRLHVPAATNDKYMIAMGPLKAISIALELTQALVDELCKEQQFAPHKVLCSDLDAATHYRTTLATAIQSRSRSVPSSDNDTPSAESHTEENQVEKRSEHEQVDNQPIQQFFAVRGPDAALLMEELGRDNNMPLAEILESSGVRRLRVATAGDDTGITAFGTAEAVALALDQVRRRIGNTCKQYGWAFPQVIPRPEVVVAALDLRQTVRRAMRTLTHPVVLVTAAAATGDAVESTEDVASFRGVTISSFTAVTLAPEPIVSFNLKLPSRTWDAISASRHLRVHFLTATRRGASIADVFTRPYEQPYQGFQILEDAGVTISSGASTTCPNAQTGVPPIVLDPRRKGVLCSLFATLLPEKCVEVGDHVIVVAQVKSQMPHNENGEASPLLNTMGLSYTMGGYRGPDGIIVPEGKENAKAQSEVSQTPNTETREQFENLASDISDSPDDLGESILLEQTMDEVSHSAGAESLKPSDFDHPELEDDPVYDVLRLTRDVVNDGSEIDIYAHMSESGEDNGPESSTSAQEIRPSKQHDDSAHNVSSRRNEGISLASGGVETTRRSFSTFVHQGIGKRAYSTTSPSAAAELTHIVHPSTLQTTVSDYLSIPDDARPLVHRVRRVWRRKQEAKLARERLAAATSGENPLSQEEATQLHHDASNKERIVAKKLAWNATLDLRVMLDKGRYDAWFYGRVGFLEGCVEQGQAVLLEEAKILRGMLEQGKVDKERFGLIKEKLNSDYAMMVTETTRLRQIVEEEGEGAWEDGDD